jgi:hypothetical protein
MSKKWFARAIMALGVGTMMLGGSSARAGFTLADLIAGTYGPVGDETHNTITVDDKIFGDFSLKTTGSSMPAAAGINVSGIGSLLGNDIGLEFQGAFHAQPFSGSSDDLLRFSVTVTDPAYLITDAHMSGNPNAHTGGVISATDSFSTSALNTNPFNTFDIHSQQDVTGAILGGDTVSSNSTVFAGPGYTKLYVSKDILADSGYFFLDPITGIFTQRSNGNPNMSYVDQQFSQTRHVPEPASFALVGLGLLGSGFVAYRRRKMAQ